MYLISCQFYFFSFWFGLPRVVLLLDHNNKCNWKGHSSQFILNLIPFDLLARTSFVVATTHRTAQEGDWPRKSTGGGWMNKVVIRGSIIINQSSFIRSRIRKWLMKWKLISLLATKRSRRIEEEERDAG